MRDAIDKHHADTGRYPDALEELVSKRYIRALPVDPITESATTWVVVPPPNGTARAASTTCSSGAPGKAGDGTDF